MTSIPNDLKMKLGKINELSKLMEHNRKELDLLKSEAIVLIKKHGLTKVKFDYNDRHIKYVSEPSSFSLSQILIKNVLAETYPEIDPKEFINRLKQAYRPHQIETIKILPNE